MKLRNISAALLLTLLIGVVGLFAADVAGTRTGTPTGARLLRPAAQAQEEPFAHPTLSGPAQRLDTPYFRVHYTLRGRDAVAQTDADGNGQPDYVEAVAATLEHVRRVQVEQFGWAAPPTDGKWGGDSRYDVYLHDIEDALGYVDAGAPETIVGDNPNTPHVRESRAGFSVMGLDNDYAEVQEEDPSADPLATMRATAAHEFHHAIQAGYDAEEPMDWLWEATATWMQEEVYDDNNEAVEDLLGVFKAGPTCQLAFGSEDAWESGGDAYGLWILLRLISERHGHETVRAIWEAARSQDGLAALETALGPTGTNLDALLAEFPVALLLRDFEEGRTFPTVRLEGTARPGTFQPEAGVGLSGQAFVGIEPGPDATGLVTVRLTGNGLRGTLVGLKAGTASLFPLRDGAATVAAGEFSQLYLIVRNPALPRAGADCRISPYAVEVSAATATGDTPDAPASVRPAPNFQAPQVEPPFSEEGGFAGHNCPDWMGWMGWLGWFGPGPNDGEDSLAGALSPLAQSLAEQLSGPYQIDDLFDIHADELDPEEVDWMMPAGNGAVALLRTEQNDEFDVFLSYSPYGTLDSWLRAVAYDPQPGERRRIDGVALLLEEWDEGYISATFIHSGFFYVVSGELSQAELLRFVRTLL